MARRFLPRIAIEQLHSDLESGGYLELVRQAAKRLTPDGIRRTKRIMSLGTKGNVLSDEVFKLFQKICGECGSQAAIDLFEQALAVERTSRPKSDPPKKRKGPHNSYRDKRLLEMFENNSDRPRVLAERLVGTPEGRAQWGVSGDSSTAVDTLLRRVKELRKNKREAARTK
jgi:hypothetical protein